ncbi:MAG: T9SS type A sorting domain-containing protein, partial [Bacteroidales bacterium]|nr:T9SS type A sorting domain-containing protein [Bacteroidales bacterium]
LRIADMQHPQIRNQALAAVHHLDGGHIVLVPRHAERILKTGVHEIGKQEGGAALLEGSEQVVNISTLAKGVYFLKIGTDRATVMRKIVVE